MNLRTVKIGTRLAAGFGVILAIVVCVFAADIFISINAQKLQNEGLRIATVKASLANLMRSSLLEGGIAMRNVGLQYSTANMLEEEAKAQAQRERFNQAREKLVALGLSDMEMAIVHKIADLNAGTDAPFKEAINRVKDYANEAAGKLISSQIDPLNQQAIAEIDKLVDLQQAVAATVLEESQVSVRRLTWISTKLAWGKVAASKRSIAPFP